MLSSQLFSVVVSPKFKTLLSFATFGVWLADKKKTKQDRGRDSYFAAIPIVVGIQVLEWREPGTPGIAEVERDVCVCVWGGGE